MRLVIFAVIFLLVGMVIGVAGIGQNWDGKAAHACVEEFGGEWADEVTVNSTTGEKVEIRCHAANGSARNITIQGPEPTFMVIP